jgi:hypothetical protein
MKEKKTATQRTWFSRTKQKINVSSTKEKKNRTLPNIWLIYSTASSTVQAGKQLNL